MAFLEHVLNPEDVAGDAKKEDVARAEVAFAQFKYLREIKGKEAAGLDVALRWSESQNSTLQMLAIRALGEISRPEAIGAIEGLEHSKNFAVAEAAKNMLTQVSRPSAIHSPEHDQ